MAPYTKDDLAVVVRTRREQQGWTQEQLGRAAGYRTGAGVSISRLEGGLLQPSPERFAGIAAALGLTSTELEAQASAVSTAPGRGPAPGGGPEVGDHAGTPRAGAKAPPGQKELNARRKRIEDETGARTRIITELGDAFNDAHDRARDEFFLRLVAAGQRIEGAYPVDPARLGEVDPARPDGGAGARPGSAASPSAGGPVGGGAAEPPGVAVGRSASGRAVRAAGGTLILAGIVAVPVGMLFAGGLAYAVKRNRTQRQEFDAQLRDAEDELLATRPGIAALEELLPQATATLDYIATHAGHAIDRWVEHTGHATTWTDLDDTERRRYLELVDIADAQVAIAGFDFQGLLITRGDDRDQLIRLAGDVLSHARAVARSHV